MKVSPSLAAILVAPCLYAAGPSHLLVEHLEKPLGIDADRPRFSWWLDPGHPDAMQTAYEIQISKEQPASGERKAFWTSGRVRSDASVDVQPDLKLAPATRYWWRVKTWDSSGSPSEWSESAWFETGLRDREAWADSKWIAHPPRDNSKSTPPAYLRTTFDVRAPIARARLYITARGLFEAWINGQRVGHDYFTPGWTDYAKQNQYLTYDVTDLLKEGGNALGAILGEGWYSGHLLWDDRRNNYGEEPSLRARLVIDYKDGASQIVTTGDDWKVGTGPILTADIYHGESYDARLALGDWSGADFDDSKWSPARTMPDGDEPLVGKISQPVRITETLNPKTVTKAANGEWIFDLGQNMVGVARLRLEGREGQTIKLRFAEMLNPDGTLYTANLRKARATDTYTFGSDGQADWHPIFTFHGFRYVGISGVDEKPDLAAIEGLVMHNDMPRTGHFECSDPLINQLQSNIVWGQRGNFFEVPTDCPQRDERLGWTGDAQIFVKTAAFNYDVRAFFEKWMGDVRDAQTPDGQIPNYIPDLGEKKSAAGWGDAAVICPWVIYTQYGDVGILEQNYEMMKRWVDYQKASAPELIRPNAGFGDWLALDKPDSKSASDTNTPKSLIGTAYFAHSADLVSRTAELLGKSDDARKYRALSDDVRAAFVKQFVKEDGRIEGDTQTVYLLALAFDLLPTAQRAQAVDRLISNIKEHDWHLTTGFLGTGVLMPTLDRVDRTDVAFRLLKQETYPSWLYSIHQGATTMWERWNSYTKDKGFGPVGMNSFNHYAYGAVGEWMVAAIGGLQSIEPGFRKSLVKPTPGGGITWARCALDTPYGRLSTDWKIEAGSFHLEAIVPPNTRAVIELPDGRRKEVGSGRHEARIPWPMVADTAGR